MNLHVPQSIGATSEVEVLLRASANIVSSQSNGPVNGIVQDGLIGSYLLTNCWSGPDTDTMVKKEVFTQCITGANISFRRCSDMLLRAQKYYPDYLTLSEDGNSAKITAEEIPGKLFLSILFPANFCYSRYSDTNVFLDKVKIVDGVILPDSAPICKKIIGSKRNSVIHVLWKDYSPEVALVFLSETQQLTDRWLPTHGFSMGISDCMTTSREEISRVIAEMQAKVDAVLKNCGGEPDEASEAEINCILNSAMNIGLRLAKTSMAKGDRNALNIMRNSGAKGSLVNLVQIVAFVGQQNISGNRIPTNLSGNSRTLPHYEAGDHSAEARGFVEHGYLDGLTPQETFFHAAGGRVGIIATAIKSVTGETPIIITDGDIPKYVKIGEWVDHLMSNAPEKIEHSDEYDLECLKLETAVRIPTTDKHGNVTWGDVTQVTRHDPTENIYRIQTEGGREVTVAESKSLLIWDSESETFQHTYTPDVKIGDSMPATQKLGQKNDIMEITCGRKTYRTNNFNGYFFGLYLAYGNSTGNECIFDIQQCPFARENIFYWLEENNISSIIEKENNIKIVDQEFSTAMENLMSSDKKHIPYEAILAPKEFCSGLLAGFFSGSNTLEVDTFSQELADGICILLSLFGIYATFNKTCVKIEGRWMDKLCKILKFSDGDNRTDNFHSHNDVVLDKIKTIKRISADPNRKLYDLTVPSTLNFGLANGLHVVDTAETGYIQKCIGRKIEDYRVEIDGSVRDANGRVIQFMCGKDGMDPKKLCISKGAEYPFFVNTVNLANRHNSDARREGLGDEIVREMSNDEIDLLLSFINSGVPKIKTPITDLATQNVRDTLRKCLVGVKINETKIPAYCSDVRDMYETSKVQYGDMVGLIASSSIGEPTTQMTLNVFHGAGLKGKDVSLGVPRVNEILNATKSNKQKKCSCTVYFNTPHLVKNSKKTRELELENKNLEEEDEQYKINQSLIRQMKDIGLKELQNNVKFFEETIVETFFESFEMRYISEDYDPETSISNIGILDYTEYSKEWWVELSEKLHGAPMFEPRSWVLKMKFDTEKMFVKDVTLEDISSSIENASEGNYCCIPSPNVLGVIDIYCNFSDIKQYVLSKMDFEDNGGEHGPLLTSDNIDFFTCRDVVVKYIKSIHIGGIMGISNGSPWEDPITHEWVLDVKCKKISTIKSVDRFLKVLTSKNVDTNRTMCDDMHAINAVFGIEAARMFIIEEMTRIISFDGTYIDPRHIELLVDGMTHTGVITSVRRGGISREGGPIAKIMFEESVDNACEASVFCEPDQIQGLMASVMFGKTARAGTGTVNICMKDKIPSKPVRIDPGEKIEDEDIIIIDTVVEKSVMK